MAKKNFFLYFYRLFKAQLKQLTIWFRLGQVFARAEEVKADQGGIPNRLTFEKELQMLI